MLVENDFFRRKVVWLLRRLGLYLFPFRAIFLDGNALFIFQARAIEIFPQFELFGAIGPHDVSHVVHDTECLVDLHPYLPALARQKTVLVDDRTQHELLFVSGKARRLKPSGKLPDVPFEPEESPRLTAQKQPIRVATPGTAASSHFPPERPVQTLTVLAIHIPLPERKDIYLLRCF